MSGVWRFPTDLILEFKRTFPTLNDLEVQACLEVAAAPFVAAVHEHMMTVGRIATQLKEEEEDSNATKPDNYKPSWA